MLANNTTSYASFNVVFWTLNGYGVTVYDILANGVIILSGTLIVLLNALVVDTMIRFKKPVEPTDVMVRSLAIADMVTGLTMLYQATYNLTNYQVYIECLIRQGILFGLVVSAVLHLTCLTSDRYIQIMFPYRYNEFCRMTTMTLLSALLWTLSILVAISPSIGWNSKRLQAGILYTVNPQENMPMCSFFGHLHPDYASFLVSIFLASFFIMGLLYLHIFKVANRHARVIHAQNNQQVMTRRKISHSWRYTKTVLIILGLYFLCWLPVGIVLTLFVCGHLKGMTVVEQGSILVYASVAAYFNSLLNPIIYALKITAVRTRFRKIFHCKSSGLTGTESVTMSRRCEVAYPNTVSSHVYKIELT